MEYTYWREECPVEDYQGTTCYTTAEWEDLKAGYEQIGYWYTGALLLIAVGVYFLVRSGGH